MTRNEAMAKIPNERWYGPEAQKGYLLDCLHELGLIKFDEEKVVNSPSMIIKNEIQRYADQPMLRANKIVDALYQAGYKIIYPEKPK